jgi:molybdopterin-guanine dinucleotide biosynthesis protein A
MGRDKARIALAGAPFATRLATLLSSLVEDVVLVGGDPPDDAPGRRVADPEGPASALRGLVGALGAARSERVIVLATDLPLMTPELLLALVAFPEADAVVPCPREGPQPLCALYRREPAWKAAKARLEAGKLAVRGVLEDLEVHRLDAADLEVLDPEGRALWNVNTADDLERARVFLGEPRAPRPGR